MSKLKYLPADADVKSIVAAVEQDGAVILDNVISKEFIAALREEKIPFQASKQPEPGVFWFVLQSVVISSSTKQS